MLKLIRGICHLRDDAKEGVIAMVQSDKRLFIFFQRTNQKNSEYLKEFKALVEVIETYDGQVGEHPGLMKMSLTEVSLDVGTASDDKKTSAKKKGKDKYIACLFLVGADNVRYRQLKIDLDNSFLKVQTRTQRHWMQPCGCSTITNLQKQL